MCSISEKNENKKISCKCTFKGTFALDFFVYTDFFQKEILLWEYSIHIPNMLQMYITLINCQHDFDSPHPEYLSALPDEPPPPPSPSYLLRLQKLQGIKLEYTNPFFVVKFYYKTHCSKQLPFLHHFAYLASKFTKSGEQANIFYIQYG